jgi:hypothetical protein
VTALTHAEAFARLDVRLRELRGRAMRGPLAPLYLTRLQETAAELTAMLPQLRRYVAALEESRGLALEEARALLARVEATDLEAAMAAVTELRRAGRVRSAVRAYLALVRRAPRDAAFVDRLAGLSLLLEEFAVNPEAGMTRTLARALEPGWWRDPQATFAVDETLRALDIDWAQLPERR